MSVDVSDLLPVLEPEYEPTLIHASQSSRRNNYKNGITMVVLFLINLLNYTDRFAIAGVLKEVEISFKISPDKSGLLQTVFVCSYMALAPVFGYLGDRYSRKWIIIVGVTFWSLTTLAGSFVPDNLFIVFLILRGLVGVGEASYICVAPTIIADMYKHDMRTFMLAIFNIAIPLGSGLGYIVGSFTTKAFHGDWRWALRVTPCFGAICIILLIILVTEPVRGSSDGVQMLKRSNWFSDVRHILKNKSFVLTTFAFTWVAFALGSLSWWGPKFLQLARNDKKTEANVSLYFGIVACAAGIAGVILGSGIANLLRKRTARADPIVCGVAVLLALPFLVALLILSKTNLWVTWAGVFISETLFCSNWALTSDMLMYIVIPSRRATASAIQIFIMHLLGDASSPYIVGVIANYFQKGSEDNYVQWSSLRNALLLTPLVAIVGGICFLIAAIFIVQDRREAEIGIEYMNSGDTFRMDESSKH
ncbi:unnamed protein product [Adineta steineri]|uniref:Major facilitator superfamily (MFS) profile domain-containing protein n=1 Tax=Adineta steineri TaxID=433720 RepID=A0A814HW88_9BILA|nr:unnamed protein product [Adineta steineri]CAF3841950.1 unnamed protein product [Adineta steineri]